MRRYYSLALSLAFFALFIVFTNFQVSVLDRGTDVALQDRVVISPSVLVMLTFGDRYLPANLEVMRLASTGMTSDSRTGQINGQYLLRSLTGVSRLNPCHEDSYYLANAMLAWGGAHEQANRILKRAMDCRHWDFLPAFLYGFNKYFFDRDYLQASSAFEEGAKRSDENSVALQRLSIMAEAERIDDNELAINYLREELRNTDDSDLKRQLEKRVERLEGLKVLREAQRLYESKYQSTLETPQTLIEVGILDVIPKDPLGVGYEFKNGEFTLRSLNIGGVRRPEP